MKDSRNVILAIVLSIVVLFGWQYFVAGPAADRAAKQAQLQQQQQQTQQAQKAATAAAIAAGAPAPEANGGATYKTRQEAIAATPRLKIDTPALSGSIDLAGGRLDDLDLKNYHVDLSDQSPIVTLLTPASAPDSYFVEQGWVAASGSNMKLPDANTVWSVDGGTAALTPTTPVTLSYDNGAGVVFHRQFAVDDNYLFTVTQTIDNKTGAPVSIFPYSQVTRHGTPESQNTFILHEGGVGILGDKNLVTYKYQDLQKDQQEPDIPSNGGWMGFTDKYWAATIIPEPKAPVTARFSWAKPGDTDVYKANFASQTPVTAAPGQSASSKTYVYAGAKVESIISAYQSQYGFDRFEFMIDWGWFSFLTHPMFKLIQLLHGLLGNFGLAILAVTVIVKLVFFPLASRSYASMASMRKMQPQMKELQEKFKDDKPALQQATMELYKKEKINPLMGCWPLLIQIPVFYSLYTVLYITIEMRHAPFFGWIQDLAAPDPTNLFTLFGLIPWHPEAVPVFGHFLMIGVWPLIMGCTMWLQMKLNPPPPDPTQAAIFQIMPIIFTFTLGTFPAGLVIYWAWNNTLSITQQYIIMKRHGAEVNLFGNIISSFRRTPKPEGS